MIWEKEGRADNEPEVWEGPETRVEARQLPRLRKKKGQCFLEDRAILADEASLAEVKGKSVLEIGAGDGRLTIELHRAGARSIVAIENDRKIAKALRMRFSSYKTIKAVEADFLEYAKLAPYFDRIVGNIPYYITSPIIFTLASMEFEKALLCVQAEYAHKMVAEAGSREYGRLSLTSQFYFNVEIVAYIPRKYFVPAPRVDSAIITLVKSGRKMGEYEEGFIAALFAHKNKKLSVALCDCRSYFGAGKEEMRKVAASIKNNERRVSSLSWEEALEVAGSLKHLKKG